MTSLMSTLRHLGLVLALLLPNALVAATLDQFEGSYVGEAEFIFEGETQRRDMSTKIEVTKKGFVLTWTSVSYKVSGKKKSKTYSVRFIPSSRDNIYESAMKKDLFGKDRPLDPLKGEPFVWARLEGDTLSVFSLFINSVGEYEVQEFHRTLVEEGLDLVFLRIHSKATEKEIRTTLYRVE
ncbi:hypothetical protein K3757_11145 [Sulfitobacter sp. S223]|uniref:hypothetical protein n=1 Tax=Sulfitobacter sp. S223 TaxID=2867023 RepID=UPI0021A4A210|nr:hypothetical protein [Sulfitobacter sp. S223]UWR25032.1 hypothetical protein K3757_11145 [Sulfitobacter sp. S223]